jgi:hypothetical protein
LGQAALLLAINWPIKAYLNFLGPGRCLEEDPGGGLRDKVDVDELWLHGCCHLNLLLAINWPIKAYLNFLGPCSCLEEDPGGGLRDKVDVDELWLSGCRHLKHHIFGPINEKMSKVQRQQKICFKGQGSDDKEYFLLECLALHWSFLTINLIFMLWIIPPLILYSR